MSQVDEVRFDNVQVPADAVLGAVEGRGWESLETAALQAIPILCAYQVGSCQAAFEMAVAYSRTRIQFGNRSGVSSACRTTSSAWSITWTRALAPARCTLEAADRPVKRSSSISP